MAAATRHDEMNIRSEPDVVLVRQQARKWALDLGFSLVDQTKIVTAASELARNTLIHGGGGTVQLEIVNGDRRRGLRLIFEDNGPGIPDITRAMTDGFTTRGGLGVGLGGAKRLSDEFEIQSELGKGTRVTICRWK